MSRFIKLVTLLGILAMSFGLLGVKTVGIEIPDSRQVASGCSGPLPSINDKGFVTDIDGMVHIATGQPFEHCNYYRTADQGVSWEPVTSLPGLKYYHVSMAYDNNSDIIYFDLWDEIGSEPSTYRNLFFYTDNAGKDFEGYQDISITSHDTSKIVLGPIVLGSGNSFLYGICSGGDYRYDTSYNSGLYLLKCEKNKLDWTAPKCFYNDTFYSAYPPRVSVLGREIAVLWEEYDDSAARLVLFRSQDDGGTWNRYYPHGSTFPNTNMAAQSLYGETDVEITKSAYYVSWDSSETFFFARSFDKGNTWETKLMYDVQNRHLGHGIELAARDDYVAALFCADGKTWFEYSTNCGKDWSEPRYVTEEADSPGTVSPRIIIDKSRRIHMMWAQIIDPQTGALFYYCYPLQGIEEKPEDLTKKITARPNPFRDAVSFEIALDASSILEPRIYDISGRLVKKLEKINPGKGWIIVSWDGRADSGTTLPAGSYFLKVQGGGEGRLLKIVKLS